MFLGDLLDIVLCYVNLFSYDIRIKDSEKLQYLYIEKKLFTIGSLLMFYQYLYSKYTLAYICCCVVRATHEYSVFLMAMIHNHIANRTVNYLKNICA